MSTLLFPLRQVPDDEADEVRALLALRGFDFYETRPSLFGISGGALWLRDSAQTDAAKLLLAGYQLERAQRARTEFDAATRAGQVPTLAQSARARPLATVLLVLAIVAVLIFSAWPFLWFAR